MCDRAYSEAVVTVSGGGFSFKPTAPPPYKMLAAARDLELGQKLMGSAEDQL